MIPQKLWKLPRNASILVGNIVLQDISGKYCTTQHWLVISYYRIFLRNIVLQDISEKHCTAKYWWEILYFTGAPDAFASLHCHSPSQPCNQWENREAIPQKIGYCPLPRSPWNWISRRMINAIALIVDDDGAFNTSLNLCFCNTNKDV